MTPEHIKLKLDEAVRLTNEGDYAAATAAVKEVLDVDQQNPRAVFTLAGVCFEQKNLDLAKDLLNEAIKLDDKDPDFYELLGNILNSLRDAEEAEKAFHKALDLDPSHGRTYYSLGNMYLSGGNKDEGVKLIKKALSINPNLVSGYLALSKAKEISLGDYYHCELERVINNPDIHPGAKSILHFSQAYIHYQNKNTKEFFHHLEKANGLGQDPEAKWKEIFPVRIKNIKTVCTREFLDERVSERFKIITPIFIVGMPRSGTTLTDQIFHTHSKCFGGDELQYFSKYLDRVAVNSSVKPGVLGYPELKMEHWEQIAVLYQKRVQLLSPGTHFFSDKMPWNYQLVGVIQKIMPWAKIIHIHRDPLDCGFSCYRSPLPKALEFTLGMEDYAFYRKQYQDIMDFWQEMIPDRFINLSYEKMVDDPKGELTRVLDFCGLPWEDGLLDFHKTERQVRTMSSDQVNKPLNKSSIGYAMQYKKELKPMITALKKYRLI